MIEKKNIRIMLCISLLIGSSGTAASEMRLYPQDIDLSFEYDDNVTREKFHDDYQYGIVGRLYTGFGIENFIPVKELATNARYTLGMRDVNTTNDEDYNSHEITLGSRTELKIGTSIYLNERFTLWNSQSDLFNFYDNFVETGVFQPLGKRTTARLEYSGRQRWFQNNAPEVQARNFIYHKADMRMYHNISSAFTIQVGYAYQYTMYNRSPVEFRGNRPIAMEGIQRDRQSVITLGFRGLFLNNTVSLDLLDQVVSSDSNSRAFDFNGNRATILLLVRPFEKLSVDFTYRIVAYNLGIYQTPELGYELSEIRSDDQSGIMLGVTYNVSDQVSLKLNYEHIENTVFFTREFYRKNTFRTGVNIKF